VESDWRPDEAVLNKVMKKSEQIPFILNVSHLLGFRARIHARNADPDPEELDGPVSLKEQNVS